jgi:high-affinity K+ transport system ATPase subunit B
MSVGVAVVPWRTRNVKRPSEPGEAKFSANRTPTGSVVVVVEVDVLVVAGTVVDELVDEVGTTVVDEEGATVVDELGGDGSVVVLGGTVVTTEVVVLELVVVELVVVVDGGSVVVVGPHEAGR